MAEVISEIELLYNQRGMSVERWAQLGLDFNRRGSSHCSCASFNNAFPRTGSRAVQCEGVFVERVFVFLRLVWGRSVRGAYLGSLH